MTDDTFTGADFEAAATETPATTDPVATDATTPVEGAATTAPGVEAAATTDTTTETKPAGPIPFDVHKTALDNARQKAVAEWEAQYGWAKQVRQEDLQEAIRIAQQAKADPIAYVQDFIKELQTHPTYGAQLKSLAAKALAARNQPTDTEPQPDLPIQLEDGRVVHLYSDAQQAKRETWLREQILAQAEQKFQPMLQTVQTLQQREAAFQQQQAVTSFVESTRTDLLTWPGMEDPANQQAVAAHLGALQINGNDPREVALALNAAYRQVVLPKLQFAERRAVVQTLNQKANAGTVNPAQASTRAPKTMDEMSIAEALAHAAAQAG